MTAPIQYRRFRQTFHDHEDSPEINYLAAMLSPIFDMEVLPKAPKPARWVPSHPLPNHREEFYANARSKGATRLEAYYASGGNLVRRSQAFFRAGRMEAKLPVRQRITYLKRQRIAAMSLTYDDQIRRWEELRIWAIEDRNLKLVAECLRALDDLGGFRKYAADNPRVAPGKAGVFLQEDTETARDVSRLRFILGTEAFPAKADHADPDDDDAGDENLDGTVGGTGNTEEDADDEEEFADEFPDGDEDDADDPTWELASEEESPEKPKVVAVKKPRAPRKRKVKPEITAPALVKVDPKAEKSGGLSKIDAKKLKDFLR